MEISVEKLMQAGRAQPDGTKGDFNFYELTVQLKGLVKDEVMSRRIEFRNMYSPEVSVDENVTISLASFQAKEMMEGIMIGWMQKIYSKQVAFNIQFNNYGGYPQKGIFLRVQDSGQLARLAQQLKIIDDYLQSNNCPGVKISRHPHIVIADCLSVRTYETALHEYSRKSFTANYTVEQVLLVRKSWLEVEAKTINNFYLMPL